VCNILKHFVPVSQRNECGKDMNQLLKVYTSCRNSHTNDRKFATSGILWHSHMFPLMQLLHSFQEIHKLNVSCGIISFKILMAHDFLFNVAT